MAPPARPESRAVPGVSLNAVVPQVWIVFPEAGWAGRERGHVEAVLRKSG